MPFSNIDKPSKYFNTLTWTGNGSSRNITGTGFDPNFVWIKNRSNGTRFHVLNDTIRGVNKQLFSNSTNSEESDTNQLTAFITDGITVGTNANVNSNGDNFVSWNWLSNSSSSSNTSGSITSTVSANTTSGFSVGTYTGTVNSETIGHGLGVAPSMIIVKCRETSNNEWVVYHKSLGINKTILLNSSGAEISVSNYWGSSNPTSSVFGVFAGGGGANNVSTKSHVFYAFAEVKGFSKFGGYTGNGSTDGTFVYTGFKPAFVMIKTTSAAESWNIGDNKRNITYPAGANVNNAELYANLSNAETDRSTRGGGVTQFDMLSNGFKCRGANPDINYSGYNYIYMAFAENPFCSSKGLPCTAR